MARIKIEAILDDLSSEMKRALDDAVKRILPDAEFNRNQLFREFKRAVGRKCSTWERVPDDHVDVD